MCVYHVRGTADGGQDAGAVPNKLYRYCEFIFTTSINRNVWFVRLQDGEFFGEYSCLTGSPRTATVVAVEYSELYSLSKNDLEKMLVDWPEMATELYSLMDEFVTGLPSTAEDEEDMSPAGINPARSLLRRHHG